MSWFRRRGDDELEPAPFEPEPVDVEVLRKRVVSHIDELLPYAVDEATPYVLDEWIDRSIEVEVARRVRSWVKYQNELMPYLIEARAELAYEEIMNDADHRKMAEYQLARDASVLELLGLADMPPQLLPRRERPNGGHEELPQISSE